MVANFILKIRNVPCMTFPINNKKYKYLLEVYLAYSLYLIKKEMKLSGFKAEMH